MTEKRLNKQQEIAALCVDQPVCILASAGCGKTTVLVQHYLELIETKRLRPSQIVVTTFSEKSAADIKQSILQALRKNEKFELLDEFSQAPISTLHGLAGRILRDASLLLGLDPHFNILDENDSAYLKKQSLSTLLEKHLKEDSETIQALIPAYSWRAIEAELYQLLQNWPQWKQRFSQSEEVENKAEQKLRNAWKSLFLEILEDYERRKNEKEALDFNDLEEKAIALLQINPWVIRHYQNQWKAFLVDEFQDTSERQDLLLSSLLGIQSQSKLPPNMHLAIVGDPKQSIYGFRGAKSGIFEKFQTIIENSGGITVHLDENYRSPQNILNFVNKLFEDIFPAYSPLQGIFEDASSLEILNKDGQDPKIKADEKRSEEAELFAQRCEKLLREEGHKASEIFLLFRAAAPMPIYLKAFKNRALPVFIKSGESLLDRQEIVDLLHAMRVLVIPQDNLAWIGLLRSPAFALSDEELLEYRLHHPQEIDWTKIHPKANFLLEQSKQQKPTSFLDKWFEQTNLLSIFTADENLQSKAQNMLQFYNFCFEWEAKQGGHIEEFLAEIEILRERNISIQALSDKLNPPEAITFMTIHQSKGLNLPVVFLPDLKHSPSRNANRSLLCAFENSWGIKLPDPKAGLKKQLKNSELFQENLEKMQKQDEAEENRVFYVATTRSMKKLILGFLPAAVPEEKKETPPHYQDKIESIAQQIPSIMWISNEKRSSEQHRTEKVKAEFDTYPHFKHSQISHFAVTQVECFYNSPEEYRRRYVYQIPAESSGARKVNKTTLTAIERGEILHQALHLLSQQKRPYAEIIASLGAQHNLSAEQNEELVELENILKKSQEHPAFKVISEASESYSEIAFRLLLGPFVLQGAMDRLIFDGEKWQVIDFKSHGIRPEQALPPAKDFEFQLKTYCLAASKMLNKPVRHAQVYFMLPNKSHPFHFSDDEMIKHEEVLKNLMQEINKTTRIES